MIIADFICHQCQDCGFSSPLKTNFVKHMASRHKKSIEGKDLSPDFACSFCEFKCVAGEFN